MTNNNGTLTADTQRGFQHERHSDWNSQQVVRDEVADCTDSLATSAADHTSTDTLQANNNKRESRHSLLSKTRA